VSGSRDPLAVDAMTVRDDDWLAVNFKGTCATQASSISHSMISCGALWFLSHLVPQVCSPIGRKALKVDTSISAAVRQNFAQSGHS
jgi:hypothetical protein